MSQVEPIQVTLGLVDENFKIEISETGETVTGKDILKQLAKSNQWKNDHAGKYLPVQFNALEFQFRPGTSVTVGESVAHSLLRSSALIVGGDQLNGPMVPFLVVLGKRELNAIERVGHSPTTCPICFEDQKTFPALARHMGKEKKLHPELFKEEARDWEGEDKD